MSLQLEGERVPALSEEKETVPVGGEGRMGVKGRTLPLLRTVAVQVVLRPTFKCEGLHETEVDVLRFGV